MSLIRYVHKRDVINVILEGIKMKRVILIIVLFLVFASFMSLNAQWARTYGGNDNEYLFSIQETKDGGYIAAGWTESFATGDENIWILKIDSLGDVEWEKTYGGVGRDLGGHLQQTADGGYILGGTTDSFGTGGFDRWILKLDSSGGIEWQHSYGGVDNDFSGPMYQTTDGGYIVSGRIQPYGAGDGNLLVMKLNSSGDIEWQRTYGTGPKDFNSIDFQQTNDGGFIAAGSSYSFGAGLSDVWILKLYSNGNIEWQKTYGGSNYEYPACIQQTEDGGYIVLGNTKSFGAGNYDCWIFKLDFTGNIEWQRTFGSIDYDNANFIIQTKEGGYIFTGYSYSFGNGDSDIWIIKLNRTGDIEWQHLYGGNGSESSSLVEQTEEGDYLIAGITDSYGIGYDDALILKISSSGEIDESCGDFIKISNATIIDTHVIPQETYITPQESYVLSQSTNVLPQDSNATSTLICFRPSSPEEQIETIIDDVEDLVDTGQLDLGPGNSLRVKLEVALHTLQKRNTTAASSQLQAFINQVNAFMSAGILSEVEGQPLIDAATQVITELFE